jgi:hypothetical protein
MPVAAWLHCMEHACLICTSTCGSTCVTHHDWRSDKPCRCLHACVRTAPLCVSSLITSMAGWEVMYSAHLSCIGDRWSCRAREVEHERSIFFDVHRRRPASDHSHPEIHSRTHNYATDRLHHHLSPGSPVLLTQPSVWPSAFASSSLLDGS